MRKSSLGKRTKSCVGLPSHLPPLNMIGETLEGATYKRNSKSMIPRPRTRSSSTHRNVVNWPFTTPVQTPVQAGFGSTVKSQGMRDTATKIPKDMRPLSDKNFQLLALQNIHNYFKKVDVLGIDRVPKTLSNSFTLKLFVEMCNHLFSIFIPNETITMTNYTEIIPEFSKLLGYPNVVKKSWLVTANSPHSLPQVLGLLSWLIDMVKVIPESVYEIMFPPKEENDAHHMKEVSADDFAVLSSERMFRYYTACYSKFSMKESHEAEEQQLMQEMMDKMKVNDSDFRELQDRISKLEQELEKPEIKRQLAENKELQAIKVKLSNELCAGENALQQKREYLHQKQQKLEKLESNVAKMESETERCVEDLSQLLKQLQTQNCTPEDMMMKRKRCRELEENIKLDEAAIEMWNNENYSLDLEMARVRSKVNKVLKDYTSLILKNVDVCPELEDMKVEVNLLKEEATKQLQDVANRRGNYIKKLQAELEEKDALCKAMKEEEVELQKLNEQVCQEDKNIEDLKQELAVMEDDFKRQEQIKAERIKRLEDDIAALKADRSALEKKIQELSEGDRKVTEHIQSSREEAEKGFQELGEEFTQYKEEIKAYLCERLSSLK